MKENDIYGIEDAGVHMVLKKLIRHDKELDKNDVTFSKCLVKALNEEIVSF